jgi:PKD repeat protein
MRKIFTTILISIFCLNAHGQTVDFNYVNSNGTNSYCSPATINFTPACTGNPIGYTWYFPNGIVSNSAIPSITLTTGSYLVKLVTVFQNQALEITKTIVVSPSISASLTAGVSNFCKPDTVNFTCTTNATGATYVYNFGDGTALVTSSQNTVSHFYSNFGTYIASVSITSANGCTASNSALPISIKKLNLLGLLNSFNGGCSPLLTNFSCTYTLPPPSTVTSIIWTFGDGLINNTLSNPIQHIYLDSGNYFPKVKITTSQGCIDSFSYPAIKVGKSPTMISAYSDKITYCGSETPFFVGTSNFANEYVWDFGDNTQTSTPDTSVSHKYDSLGIKIIKVTPYYNGCAGTPRTFTINVIGVIAKYSYSNTCADRKKFTLNNLSLQSLGSNSMYTWSFGDGSSNANTFNAIHTYPTSGTFYTKLKAEDPVTGCKDSITYPIYTANPTLVNTDTFVCRRGTTTFNIVNNYAAPQNIIWSALGQIFGIPPDYNNTSTQIVDANAFGNYGIHQVIIDNGQQYCKDTATLIKTISVRGPSASFNTGTSFCTNNNFILNNTSFPYTANDTIKQWNWTFGIPGLSDTAFQPTSLIYTNEGTYTIQLIAKDRKACTDTMRKEILVKESPFLRIFPRSVNICSGTSITLTAYHTDTLAWSPNSMVACFTCDTTVAVPMASNIIYATASNAVGCSLRDSCIVIVNTPFTATATPNTFFACKNDTVGIRGILPLHKKILWSTNYGITNTNSYTPIATVLGDTVYDVKLTDSSNCYNSTVKVYVKENPPAFVNAGPDRLLAANSTFTITPNYSPGITNYEWTPAGNLNCTNCANPTGIADKVQRFIIKATTAKNCVAKDTINIFVECAYANLFMASAFSPTNTSINKYYFPQTRGVKKINKFSIYNRLGELVYEIKNATPNIRNLGWDGKYKGLLQDVSAYVYFLEAICEQGEVVTKQGTFLLVK